MIFFLLNFLQGHYQNLAAIKIHSVEFKNRLTTERRGKGDSENRNK